MQEEEDAREYVRLAREAALKKERGVEGKC
jgi:hypothetical protein